MPINNILEMLQSHTTSSGIMFDCEMLKSDIDVEVLRVSIANQTRLPVFITATDNQILCMINLWKKDEINSHKHLEVQDYMLELSVSMPLSSFGIAGERYVLFGALSRTSTVEQIAEEVITLTQHADDCVEAFSEYTH